MNDNGREISAAIGSTRKNGGCNACFDPSHYLDNQEVVVLKLKTLEVRLCADCWDDLQFKIRAVNL